MYAQPPTASPPSSAGLNSNLASDLKLQVDALRKRGAKNGAYRLREVIDHFQYYTVEGAARYICRDDIVDELENQPFWLLSLLRGLRNVLSIAPIVITWFALYSAANAYVKDLAATRDDLYQPFLLLWQKGFHGQIPPFASAALFDFLALLFLVFIIIAIPVLEHRRRNALQKSLSSFDALLNDLLEAIGQGGANAHLADSDINKITQAIQSTLGRLMMGYDRVADEARK